MERNKKIMYSGLAILLLVLLLGILWQNRQLKTVQEEGYQFPSPEAVVRQYFTAWNEKNYPDMYATLSDGFKKIDPNAKDLATFRQFASAQGIEGLKIKGITEKSNDGQTAEVEYTVEFTLADGTTKPFQGTYTLKYRRSDVIQGWKLIHPYGENIDRS